MSALPGANRGWKAGLPTEVALDGLHFGIVKPEILHVAQHLAVLGPTNVHHERLVAVSNHMLQLKPFDEINLCFPAARFENAFIDVVVVVCAGKSEVVRQQDVDRMPVLFLPRRIVLADSRLVVRTQSRLRVRTQTTGRWLVALAW